MLRVDILNCMPCHGGPGCGYLAGGLRAPHGGCGIRDCRPVPGDERARLERRARSFAIISSPATSASRFACASYVAFGFPPARFSNVWPPIA
jgi:hypothetical protein